MNIIIFITVLIVIRNIKRLLLITSIDFVAFNNCDVCYGMLECCNISIKILGYIHCA